MKPWFDKYAPISIWGWVVYVAAVAVLVWDYRIIDQTSGSVSETVFTFFPHFAGVFLLVALIIKTKRINNEK